MCHLCLPPFPGLDASFSHKKNKIAVPYFMYIYNGFERNKLTRWIEAFHVLLMRGEGEMDNVWLSL
jgi:hypothetical protein